MGIICLGDDEERHPLVRFFFTVVLLKQICKADKFVEAAGRICQWNFKKVFVHIIVWSTMTNKWVIIRFYITLIRTI